MDWKNALRPPGMGLLETFVKQAGGTLQSAAQMATRVDLILTTWGLQRLAPLLMRKNVGAFSNVKHPKSYLGTPVIDSITIMDQSNPEETELLLQLDCVIIDADLPKVIKYTELQGRNGTIKEYIADGDWIINIKGVLIADTKEGYPEEEIETLRKLCSVKSQVYIASNFVNGLLDVTSIVIERLRLPQREGKISQQAFEIIARSDMPYELEISE